MSTTRRHLEGRTQTHVVRPRVEKTKLPALAPLRARCDMAWTQGTGQSHLPDAGTCLRIVVISSFKSLQLCLIGFHTRVECEMHMRCDRSTARGMSARQGLRNTRHVDVRHLWLQQAVQRGCLKVLRVPTSENLSDTFTKSLSQADAVIIAMYELPQRKRWKQSPQ